MNVSADVLLKGAWYALEQSGRLLQDAVKLCDLRSYASAAALALLAREELGRYRILLKLWRRAINGDLFSVQDVRAACDDHVSKQRHAQLSMTYRVEPSTGLAQLFRGRIETRPGTPEYKRIDDQLKQLDDTMRKRTPEDRHEMRMTVLYLDINDYGTDWIRPAAISRTKATNELTDAVNDYSLQLDKIAHDCDSTLAGALTAWPDRPTLPDPVWPREM